MALKTPLLWKLKKILRKPAKKIQERQDRSSCKQSNFHRFQLGKQTWILLSGSAPSFSSRPHFTVSYTMDFLNTTFRKKECLIVLGNQLNWNSRSDIWILFYCAWSSPWSFHLTKIEQAQNRELFANIVLQSIENLFIDSKVRSILTGLNWL